MHVRDQKYITQQSEFYLLYRKSDHDQNQITSNRKHYSLFLTAQHLQRIQYRVMFDSDSVQKSIQLICLI